MKVRRENAMKISFMLMFGLLPGCIGMPQPKMGAGPGAVPPTPQQVSNCQTTRTWHNAWTLLGTVFGGVGGASGTAETLTQDKTAQTGIAIGIAGAGLVAAVSAAAAGIESEAYATQNCNAVLSASAYAGAAEPEKKDP